MQHSILIVDDNKDNLEFLRSVFRPKGYDIYPADNVGTAASIVRKKRGKLSVALVDHHLSENDGKGHDAIKLFKTIDPDLQFLTITGDSDDSEEIFRQSVAAGAGMLFKRNLMGIESLYSAVASYCTNYEQRVRVLSPKETPPTDKQKFILTFDMIGNSDELVDVCNLIVKYGGSSELQSVLIRGEHGVGKEKVARAIHTYSPISDGPFVSVNCSAINEGVIESELFGHVRGAFTGAVRDRKGHFREAQNGTLFLDEIGDMPHNLQAKLLRAIQEKEIYPVGASQPIKVNVRIIAATNVDLEAAVKNGKFRADLHSRLDVLPINLPPLRKRKADIEPLVLHLLHKRGREGVRARAMTALKAYDWPSNVREVESVMARALVGTDEKVIELHHLDDRFQKLAEETEENPLEGRLAMKTRHENEERTLLTAVIRKNGSLSAAARALDLAKATLHGRVKALGIKLDTKED